MQPQRFTLFVIIGTPSWAVDSHLVGAQGVGVRRNVPAEAAAAAALAAAAAEPDEAAAAAAAALAAEPAPPAARRARVGVFVVLFRGQRQGRGLLLSVVKLLLRAWATNEGACAQ